MVARRGKIRRTSRKDQPGPPGSGKMPGASCRTERSTRHKKNENFTTELVRKAAMLHNWFLVYGCVSLTAKNPAQEKRETPPCISM